MFTVNNLNNTSRNALNSVITVHVN